MKPKARFARRLHRNRDLQALRSSLYRQLMTIYQRLKNIFVHRLVLSEMHEERKSSPHFAHFSHEITVFQFALPNKTLDVGPVLRRSKTNSRY